MEDWWNWCDLNTWQIPWKDDDKLLSAWRDARTGHPWIDAAMVQVQIHQSNLRGPLCVTCHWNNSKVKWKEVQRHRKSMEYLYHGSLLLDMVVSTVFILLLVSTTTLNPKPCILRWFCYVFFLAAKKVGMDASSCTACCCMLPYSGGFGKLTWRQ